MNNNIYSSRFQYHLKNVMTTFAIIIQPINSDFWEQIKDITSVNTPAILLSIHSAVAIFSSIICAAVAHRTDWTEPLDNKESLTGQTQLETRLEPKTACKTSRPQSNNNNRRQVQRQLTAAYTMTIQWATARGDRKEVKQQSRRKQAKSAKSEMLNYNNLTKF